jgi:hypothetical protein
MRREITVQAAIEPTPTRAAARREVRGPSNDSQRKLAKGMTGTRKRSPNTLAFHVAHCVGIERLSLVINLQH